MLLVGSLQYTIDQNAGNKWLQGGQQQSVPLQYNSYTSDSGNFRERASGPGHQGDNASYTWHGYHNHEISDTW